MWANCPTTARTIHPEGQRATHIQSNVSDTNTNVHLLSFLNNIPCFSFRAWNLLMCKANICRLWECVWSGIYCVYLVRGVRQISWCVTGAIKVVALDTAHEQHNDSGFMLISPCLAPSWAAGQFSCQAQPKLRWRIEQDSATALRLLAQVGEKARAGGKKEKPEQGRSWILSSRSLFFVVFFHPLLFSFLSYAFLSFIYRCCRFSFLFFEIVLDLKKKKRMT